jgi:outer membrane protein assembly factor BamB
MNEEPRAQEPQDGKQNSPALPRLGFPTGLILIYWSLYFVVGGVEKPYFHGFLYGMASSLVFALSFLGWWWFNRSIRWPEKLAGFAVLVAGAWVAGRFSHRSINLLSFCSVGFPLVVTFVIAWMALVRRTLIPPHRIGFAAVVALTWGSFLFIRNDGLDSTLHSQIRWRWTPTAEELFLAHQPSDATPTGASRSATASTLPSSSSTNWTAFRGPDRDGVVHGTSMATDWKSAPPQALWRHAVGPAWSSLIVIGDRLYTQEQRGTMEAVVCYDSSTGSQLWTHEDETRFDEAVSGPGPRATPSFAEGRLLTLGATGILNCLDAESGKLQWSRDLKNDSQGKVPMWGFSSAPLIAGHNVIVYGGGEAGKSLLAYRLETGDLVWTAATGQNTYSSPQLTTIASVPQCLILHDCGLTSVDPATGKKLWETGLVMRGVPRSSQPRLVGENRLAVAVLDGPGTSLIEVSRNDEGWHVSPVWTSKDLKPEFPDFVVHEGYAYGFDSSIFCCLDLATGKRAWKEGRFGRGQVILLADQALLLVISETGDAVLLAAEAQKQKELGRFHALNGKTWNHPVIANGRLYLRNAEEMACYAVEPGKRASLR